MYFDSSCNHAVANIPAPVLFADRNRQTCELLMNEAQRIISNINCQLTPNVRFAFEIKYYVCSDGYSPSFKKELKKMISGYYTFHKYKVTWIDNLLEISWAPKPFTEQTCCYGTENWPQPAPICLAGTVNINTDLDSVSEDDGESKINNSSRPNNLFG